MKNRYWIGIIIGAIVLSLIAGSQLFPKTISDDECFIQNVDSGEELFTKVREGYEFVDKNSCVALMMPLGYSSIKYECYIKEAELHSVSGWNIRCVCFKEN